MTADRARATSSDVVPHPVPSGQDVGAWDAAWEAALTALELDLAAAEHMLTLDRIAEDPPDLWAPPVGLGPLPATLVDRAQALLDRQIETGRRLAEAAELSRRHSRAAQALRSTGPTVPVYIDTPA